MIDLILHERKRSLVPPREQNGESGSIY
ncbi:MAG: hypothetical protein HW404_1958, partial [Anaerolineales bacterium]|nr:hypothetical protein [Anaerolineales bacterium]